MVVAWEPWTATVTASAAAGRVSCGTRRTTRVGSMTWSVAVAVSVDPPAGVAVQLTVAVPVAVAVTVAPVLVAAKLTTEVPLATLQAQVETDVCVPSVAVYTAVRGC